MDVMQIIKGRRAVRKFKEEGIPTDTLLKILEAGIWAPSGSNIQPWEFIVVMNKETIEKIKLISPGLFGNPVTVIIICINKERSKKAGKLGETMAIMDISMAAQNMMLMAYSLGIGSCPIVSFSKIAVKELLEIPEYVEPVLMVSLGYPEFWPKPPKRRPLEEVVHVEKFDQHF